MYKACRIPQINHYIHFTVHWRTNSQKKKKSEKNEKTKANKML